MIVHGQVLDIGGGGMKNDISDRLKNILRKPYDEDNKPKIPDEPLYMGQGLFIWNEIIFVPNFYQTWDEMQLFDEHGEDVVRRVEAGVSIIDIGAGDTRKVEHLLAAFEKAKVPVTYLALDISKASLEHNVGHLAKLHSKPSSPVTCAGIWGTFEDGQRFVVDCIKGPRLFLSLGSVLCNDDWVDAVTHLKAWRTVMRPGDLLLAGMDGHMAEHHQKIEDAYHTREDLWQKFFLNGLGHINKLLGQEVFRKEDWCIGCDLEKDPTTRHRVYLKAQSDIKTDIFGRVIREGEEIEWFDSHKYGEESVRLMCSKAGLSVETVWKHPGSEFRQYMIRLKDARDPKEDDDSGVSGLS